MIRDKKQPWLLPLEICMNPGTLWKHEIPGVLIWSLEEFILFHAVAISYHSILKYLHFRNHGCDLLPSFHHFIVLFLLLLLLDGGVWLLFLFLLILYTFCGCCTCDQLDVERCVILEKIEYKIIMLMFMQNDKEKRIKK